MIRIVKLTFKPEYRNHFLQIVADYKDRIRGYEGCGGVDFLHDRLNPNIFFTYSRWMLPENLEHYRESELFQEVWTQVKQWFDAKPEAWSVDEMGI